VGGPPLLPMLYALMGGVTPGNYLPAQIVNLLSHTAVSVFTFLIMRRLYEHDLLALLTGTLAAFSPPLLWNTHYMLKQDLPEQPWCRSFSGESLYLC
jgi:hypothetical protein